VAFVIADTDVLIDYLKSIEPGRTRIADGITARTLVTTVVSEFELVRGARTESQRRDIQRCWPMFPSYPWTAERLGKPPGLRSCSTGPGSLWRPPTCSLPGLL